MYKYWSPKEISLLKKYYPKLRVKDLAKMFPKRTKATIVAKALSLGLPSAKLWQTEENNILYKNFAEATKEKLLKLLPKRSWTAILAQGERLGLKRQRNKPRLKVNEYYFKKWSANMAYILGFILADGSIIKEPRRRESDKLSFGVNQKDIDVLKKIKKELSSEHKLSLTRNCVYLSIQSQKIVDDLKKLGITYRKSFKSDLNIKIPNMPKKYIRDFIRGIVDGDGSINFNKKGRQKGRPNLSVCGKKKIITFIRNDFFRKFNIYSKVGQRKKDGQLYELLFYIGYRCNSAKKLINYLYTNADLYLERKFKLAKRASETKIKQRKNYTKEENRILRHVYHDTQKNKILSILPSRNWSGIQRHAWQLGLTKLKRRKNLCT